ncbi:MAG: hypothetical protein U0271_14360 [Polyangiaceae bacterium]
MASRDGGVRVIGILIAASFAACGSNEPKQTEPSISTSARAASSAQPAESVASSAAPAVSDDAAARTDACIRATESLDPDAEPYVATRTVVEACLSIYREPVCRDGMLKSIDPKTDPSQRSAILTNACARAYCPRLTEKPAFCTASANNIDPLDRASLFAPLRTAILDLEVGPANRERLDKAFAAAVERRKAAQAQKPEP